jgi:transcriptional regulator with XRE-family HTH domain
MSNVKQFRDGIPEEAWGMLQTLGANLRIARRRRKWSLAALADRVMVSVPTARKLERGDPSVSLGVFVAALWAMGLSENFEKVAAPETDKEGLFAELRKRQGPDNDF